MTEDATVVESTSGDLSLDIQTPAEPSKLSPVKSISALSPIKSASSRRASASPIKKEHSRSPEKAGSVDSSALDRPAKEVELDNDAGTGNEHDSIFGVDDEEAAGGNEKLAEDENMDKDVSPKNGPVASPKKPTSPVKGNHPVSDARPVQEDVDYGYLYTVSFTSPTKYRTLNRQWWSIFEDTQRLSRAHMLRARPPRTAVTVPNTALPPTSAMAARIAVSNSADAVRASSIDAGLRPAPVGRIIPQPEGDEPPPTAITATLRAADEVRMAQQAQIQAAQDGERRKSLVVQNAAQMMQVVRTKSHPWAAADNSDRL